MNNKNDPFSDPKRYQHGQLSTLHYKHPKYCHYKKDQNTVYKVIGYHTDINKYKIQSTSNYTKVLLVDPMEVLGIWGRENTENLKKLYP